MMKGFRSTSPCRGLGLGVLAGSLAFALLLASASPARAGAEPAEVVAIVHLSNPTQELSIRGLRLLYGLYKRAWPGGEQVRLLVPALATPAMDLLAREVLRKPDDADVSRFYLTAVFRGRIARQPRIVSDYRAVGVVRDDPGAIALMHRLAENSRKRSFVMTRLRPHPC